MAEPKLLLVEDNGIIAMDIQNRLQHFGYSVCGKVNSGQKAIEKAEELNPDLVLMDIVIKGEMDGIDAAKIIQTRFNIPVIFMTAHADEKRFERAKVIAPFGYIIKPFRDRELKTTIEMVLYKARVDKKRRVAEEALKESEKKYQQAQKMESIGRLAGGVAHDYNNALSIIMGYAEMSMMEVEPNEQLYGNLEEILKTARHATSITRQLLTFARKQTIMPLVLDLNKIVEGMLKMLRRLIGEDINFAWMPGGGLWPVKMDPTQIDQILANLCVNSRDAIKDVGKITIESKNVTFSEKYCNDNKGFVPGEFVLLVVSDDGCGMEKEIQSNIFEPFFTTKELDKGTGLGLSTVYGIIKQNNGFVNVYSEPDNGTTIKIYLPRYKGKSVKVQEKAVKEIPLGHGETILLVEDDLSILNLTRKVLTGLGYKVLIAGTPGEAINVAKVNADKIHLLISDVVMPEMNGRQLAVKLQSIYPDLKSMFMSGYTANVIAHHGVLDKAVFFIQKPFSKRELAEIVRKVLDA